jgi:metal-responsive CopG/Arc/MetJ family transcriptional regulator
MDKVITFRIDKELLKALDVFAKQNKAKRSDVLRVAIQFFLTHGYKYE